MIYKWGSGDVTSAFPKLSDRFLEIFSDRACKGNGYELFSDCGLRGMVMSYDDIIFSFNKLLIILSKMVPNKTNTIVNPYTTNIFKKLKITKYNWKCSFMQVLVQT